MPIGLPLQCEVDRPLEDGGFCSTSSAPFLDDSVVEFFQQTRHGGEYRGLAIGQVLFDGLEAFSEVNIRTNVHVQVVEHALENVANRQEAQHPVIRIHEDRRNSRNALHHGLGDVVVAEHDTLWGARGS